ncbi:MULTISPECIES: hypothetical protein [unclassified Gilliamella]|uniref:hypothetical protein n=1 Tax=unclassified Gilliamella TaxID=2685620 RepID=UPI002269AE81|nr:MULTISPECIES: hypothetical protein [unclassified Gilliamella]MCX8584979.1 hypothetical protein [Gilliamella sp. B3562]MCX8684626.1 hypothetical protein [Gilliamella sp. B2864]
MVFFLPFSGHALTSQTTRNVIQGSAPYLTFDGGRTRAVDTNGLLGITLSDGTRYTPSTNTSSSSAPISLPVEGQSFADIRMFVPTNTNSVDLSALIGPPNNYWGDDDGDADVTATGSLSLSIVDKNNQPVSRDTMLTTCTDSAPYKVTLSSSDGILSTRYGFPNRSTFRESSVTYYVNPKPGSSVCVKFARPNLRNGTGNYAGPASMWDPANGFIPQSTGPSSYGRNFPTTGANGLYFDLLISGSSQPLFWSPVSQGGITVTMSNSTATSVRVTLTGPYATPSQISSANPGPLSTISLPQNFELVGRDSNGTPVVKYGFTLKQWFVNRGDKEDTYPNTLSWCNSLGYRMPSVKVLTNASCRGTNSGSHCQGSVGATPSSRNNFYMRHIGSGFFTEWGSMEDYSGVGFVSSWYWTSDPYGSDQFVVYSDNGSVNWLYTYNYNYGLCAYP